MDGIDIYDGRGVVVWVYYLC